MQRWNSRFSEVSWWRACLPLLVVLVAGCSGGDRSDVDSPADSMTRAQRDSMIGASSLPGARAVQRALDVSDSAAARAAAMDSLIGN